MVDYLLWVNKGFAIVVDNHVLVVEQGMLFSLKRSWQLLQALWENGGGQEGLEVLSHMNCWHNFGATCMCPILFLLYHSM